MLLIIFTAIVVIILTLRVYLNHSLKNHKAAFFKAFFIWFFSTLPIILSSAFSSPQDKNGDLLAQFVWKIGNAFTLDELFIYTASFLSPVLYVFVDVVLKVSSGELEINRKDIGKHLRGMQWIFVFAIFLLIATAMTFAQKKLGAQESFFFLAFGGEAYILYLWSLLMWYSCMLRETVETPDIGQTRSKESSDLARRLKERQRARSMQDDL